MRINKHDEIDLKQILTLVISKKITFIKVTCVILFFSITYCIFKTPLYSSNISIYLINENATNVGNTMTNLQGVASSFGINIGAQSNILYYIPDIIGSRTLKKNIILNKWTSKNHEEKINLVKYWKIDDDSPFSLLKIIKNIFSKEETIDLYSKYIESAITEFSKRIIIEEYDSGLFKVYILMEEPQLSADIANYISNYIEFYISNDVDAQSTKYRVFLEDRLRNAQNELNIMEIKLTKFRKKHLIALDTPDLQLKRMRLIRDVEINQEVYLTLMTQHELAKMNELKEKPAINILDKADPSVEKKSPKISQILIISIVFSILLSIVIILFNNYSINNKLLS